jgi:hypothetical protein
MTKEFLSRLQTRTAEAAIGASALRNQGAKGVVKAAREELAKTKLKSFAQFGSGQFLSTLNRTTETVKNALPTGAQNWGAARKAINLFLRDSVYNRDLSEMHGLKKIRRWLEVPLDRDVGSALRNEPEGKALPLWPGLKKLTPEVSGEFQAVATKVAKRKRVARVDLDVYFWRGK